MSSLKKFITVTELKKQIPPPPEPKQKPEADASKVAFDCNLRDYREKHRLTLRLVSEASGVPVPTIARMERGETCQLEPALRLAKFYETPVESIWRLKDTLVPVNEQSTGGSISSAAKAVTTITGKS